MADAPSATAGAQSSNEEPTSAAAARLASAATALSTLKLALPAVVPQLPASPSPRWFEVVHFPTVIVRKEPSMLAKPLGTALFGDLIAVEAVEVHQNQAWARLTAAERHSLVINYQIHEVAVEAAWMLIDGTSLGLSTLLREALPALHPPLPQWQLPHRLYLAAFHARDERLYRTSLPHEDTTRRDSGVVVTLCDEAYWREQRRTNFFFKPHPRWQRWQGGSKDLSTANFEKGDVQCRQCVVVQDATERARAGGVDWLLHIDIDELWYSPHPACQRDARQSFRAVPPSVSELIFHNHEAVPRYASREGECWFTRNTLFKIHSAFTRSVAANEAWEERTQRAIRRGEQKDGRAARRSPRDPSAAQEAGVVLAAARAGRKDATAADAEADADAKAEASTDHDEEILDPWFADDILADLDDPFSQRLSGVRRERARRMRLEKVSEVDANALWREYVRLHQHEREHGVLARWAGDPDVVRKDGFKALRRAMARAKKAGGQEGAAFTYYLAHAQGKAAVRLRPSPGAQPYEVPPRAGIHKWSELPLMSPRATHYCEGAGAPVILHYANANYSYWLTKYRMLTVDTTGPGEGAQISLKGLKTLQGCLAKMQDGTSATDAMGDIDPNKRGTTQGMHELAAALVGLGDYKTAGALFKQQFAVVDCLPVLASHGLLCEVSFPEKLLRERLGADCDPAEASEATHELHGVVVKGVVQEATAAPADAAAQWSRKDL